MFQVDLTTRPCPAFWESANETHTHTHRERERERERERASYFFMHLGQWLDISKPHVAKM